MLRRLLSAVAFLALLSTTLARADDTTSALINQALDKRVKMTLNGLLPQTMEEIQKQTGVPIKADPGVWDLLPWGRDTSIKTTIDDQTLRQALEAITRKLGLSFVVKNDALVLEPIPALRRLARRSTANELALLEALSKETLEQSGQMSVKALLDAVDAKLKAGKSEFVVERPSPESINLDAQLNVPRNSTLLDALEKLADQTTATWYPWGTHVVVLSKPDEVKRQLARTITVRYNGVDVAQVLTELAQRAGVKFDLEAGAIQSISPESRNIRLVLDDYSVQDALDAIGGITGLDYMIKDTGVYIWNQTSSATHRDPVMIIMTIRGTDMQLLIPTSQVPADIRDYCKAKMQGEFKAVRDMMKDEGFHPSSASTQPTGPTTKPPATKRDEDL
jgi:hypothetical protein